MEQNDLAAKGVKRADNENFCIIKSQRKRHKNVDEKKNHNNNSNNNGKITRNKKKYEKLP